MERLHKADTSGIKYFDSRNQKLNSESKTIRHPILLCATCKVMGKVKQLLPQAAPNLCQDATENLRGEREDGSGETSQDGAVIAVWEVAARTLKYFKPLWNGFVFVSFLTFGGRRE